MKLLLKILLVCSIIVFAFFNYKFITFSQGISKPSHEDMSVQQVLNTELEIVKVRYYKKTIAPRSDSDKSDYIYRMLIETEDVAYLLDATQADIDSIDPDLNVRKAIVIPFYVEIILGLVVMLVPFGPIRRKKAKQ